MIEIEKFKCPIDNSGLVFDQENLKCKSCGKVYKVLNGIPRFVEQDNYASSFGFEWNNFSKVQVDSFNQVGQSIQRIEIGMDWHESDVKGKLVLDVGCGSGRFVEIMSKWGAKIVGLDYSNAVDAAKKVTGDLSLDAEYVQGDALALPFADNTFDCVYSIGVLQHTADPLKALEEMCRVLKPGGLIGLHGVYVRSLKKFLHPKYILRPITTKIPTEKLFKIVKAWVTFALPISRFMRKNLKMRQGLVERLTAVANYEGAVPGVDDSNVFDWALLDTFDWFSPTYDQPLKPHEIVATMEKCGMENIRNLVKGVNDFRATKKISFKPKRNYRFDPAQYNTHMLLMAEVPTGSRVLEIGSASGYLGEYMVNEKKCEVWGVEPVKEYYDDSQKCGYTKLFHNTVEDFLKLPELNGEKFDVILLGDVLEHLVHPDEVLSKLKEYLRADGRVVISLPNIAHYSTRFGLLKGYFDMQDGGILDRTHLRFFTLKTMKELIENSGCRIEKYRPSSGYIERFGLHKLFGIGQKLLWAWPTFFSVQFIFVAKKK